MNRGWQGGFVVAAVVLWGACGGETGNAQEASVVPAEPGVLQERVDRARVKGSDEALIRMVDISDFQCPFCAQYHRETFPGIDSLYIQTGLINYIWVSYPNPNHSLAWPAIKAAYCAGAVGKFWEMHEILFDRQGEWTQADDPFSTFVDYAAGLNIDRESYADCYRNDRTAPLQVRDYGNAVRAGIGSTPYFILADSVAIRGAADLATFQEAIDTLLVLRGHGATEDE